MLPLADFYQGRILNFAHRGARYLAPENTLPAFRLAAELGADGVELDIQFSADFVPVVIHDSRREATTNGKAEVRSLPLAELRLLDAGGRCSAEFARTSIPTLEEVFEEVGRQLLFNIELKDFGIRPDLAAEAVRLARLHNMQSRAIFSSFNPLVLRHVRRLAPELPVGYLYAPRLPLPLARGWLARPIIGVHEARHPHFSMVDEKYMMWARRLGYRVNVWTVNEPADIARMKRLGVDMIMTDYPDRVSDVLDSGG